MTEVRTDTHLRSLLLRHRLRVAQLAESIANDALVGKNPTEAQVARYAQAVTARDNVQREIDQRHQSERKRRGDA